MSDTVHLPYTLQTWLGMIISRGRPAPRGLPLAIDSMSGLQEPLQSVVLPSIDDFDDYLQHDWTRNLQLVSMITTYFQNDPTVNTNYARTSLSEHEKRFLANINACRARITWTDLKRLIFTRTRLDLEQAAAVVVSAMVTSGHLDYARELVKEMTGILTSSNMWIPENKKIVSSEAETIALRNLCEKVPVWIAKTGTEIEPPQSLSDLIEILLRVRRCAPRDRCLHIPNWMFRQSGTQRPEYMSEFHRTVSPFEISKAFPSFPPMDDVIVLSRNTFRALQRSIFRLFRFWRPECRLQRDIQTLEGEAFFPTEWIDKHVLKADSIAYLCHWFFHCQRRLQKTVVSNVAWSRFLRKGEGKTIYQNNIRLQSTFEKVLETFAERVPGGRDDESLGTPEKVLKVIDQTCMLMKEYVSLFGAGNKDNLTYKLGKRGGSGRGPVDQYNMLCDILAELKRKAQDMGISDLPGPVHKFLAKDIMSWNNAWGDDAFANGKIPGWETWLSDRAIDG